VSALLAKLMKHLLAHGFMMLHSAQAWSGALPWAIIMKRGQNWHDQLLPLEFAFGIWKQQSSLKCWTPQRGKCLE